jgi:hypothetical protein
VLGTSVDPQQVRILAADSQDVRAAGDGDLEVAVRDPTAERLDLRGEARPDALDHLLDAPHGARS